MSKEIIFSIIIPVKNGAYWLDKLFQKLIQQTLIHQAEIIVIDSGSTDTSLEIIKKYPVRLIQIPSSEFDHGDTRNLGAREAKGKYVVMTVQDAIPVSEKWLQFFLDGFINDTVAAVCGQQIVPHDKDKNPVDWFHPASKPSISSYSYNVQDFKDLAPAKKKQICGWDNVTACYKREVLLKVPFRKISFAEDLQWCVDAIQAGYTIVYNTFAQVYHYHQMDDKFAFTRSLTELYARYKIIGFKPQSANYTIKRRLQIIKILWQKDMSLAQKWEWWKYNMANYKQYKKAFKMFSDALKKGESELDAVHQQYCGITPMAQIVNIHG